jgi:hypothetical protein
MGTVRSGQQLDRFAHLIPGKADAGQLLQRLKVVGLRLEQMPVGLFREGLVTLAQT